MSAAATPAGAAPGLATGWHAIDWQAVSRNVRRLQARIVKAVQEGRWGKARALSYLLTHSFSGRAMAVLRVPENSGSKTPGFWLEQEGTCPVCHQGLTLERGWHIHHIQWRSHGGTDLVDNLLLLHPNCHRQVHSQGIR